LLGEKMTEITIKVPNAIRELIKDIDEPIYLEAVKVIARKKLQSRRKQIKELELKNKQFEKKYSLNFDVFSTNLPDSKEAHDDWIEWTYIISTFNEMQKSMQKLEQIL
jgi:hypothetical protein